MFVDTKETSFLYDLSKPSAKALSYILRHRELWPTGFEWDYNGCETCAMGLAHQLWIESIAMPGTSCVAPALGLDEKKAKFQVFVSPELFNKINVTPEMVADKLDELVGA